MFKVERTYKTPSKGANAQRGFPAPGDGYQTIGEYEPAPAVVPWSPNRPTKGRRSMFAVKPAGQQRGFPAPGAKAQIRPAGSRPNVPVVYGRNVPVWTPEMDRGASAYVQNYGKVLTNPIGAGVVAMNRPQASYGKPAEYHDQTIWWVSQSIPTSVNLQGLVSPRALEAVLGGTYVQAAVRVG